MQLDQPWPIQKYDQASEDDCPEESVFQLLPYALSVHGFPYVLTHQRQVCPSGMDLQLEHRPRPVMHTGGGAAGGEDAPMSSTNIRDTMAFSPC
jgi:hypothetical protein